MLPDLHKDKYFLWHMHVHDESETMICVVPKAGFVFWTQLDINADTKPKLKRLSDYNEKEILHRIKKYKKVFLSREPSQRLWSAYNDKYVFPAGYFRRNYAREIFQRIGLNELNYCNDLTFSQFIGSLIRELKVDTLNANEHWETYNRICRPCDMQYTFHGKMENFKTDFEIVKRMLKINDLKFISTPLSRFKAQMEEYPTSENMTPCLSNQRYMKLLWKSIQGTGHVDMHSPLPKVSNYTKDH